jgi:5'-deoxynucleotidase YfbR-like HD superfamily hydrolase
MKPIIIFSKDFVKNEIDFQIEGVRRFISNIFPGNWQWRFKNDTPYMTISFKKGQRESVNGHMMAAAHLWNQYSNLFPKLSKVVDSKRVLLMLLGHDLGEIPKGDVSIGTQLKNGLKKDRIDNEKLGFIEVTSSLPENQKKELVSFFDAFEFGYDEVGEVWDMDALIARLIDSIVGDYFMMDHYNDIDKYWEQNALAIKTRMNGCVNQIIKIFNERGQMGAKNDVLKIVKYHIEALRKNGIKVELDLFRK